MLGLTEFLRLENMAGSLRGFPYTDANGDVYTVIADESNTEAANGAGATAPAAGSDVRRNAGNLRQAVYRNPVTGATRTVLVLTEALLLALPAVIQFLSATAGSAGTAQAFNLVRTKPQTSRRYGGDTGLTDGDAPD
jgi:hypothetical protein